MTNSQLPSIRRTRRRLTALSLTGMIALSVVVLVPFYYLLVTTMKTPAEAAASPMGLPSSINLGVFVDAFIAMDYPRAFLNTAIITVSSVLGVIALSAMAGYALNRNSKSRIAGAVFLLLLSGLMFPYQMSILGLYDLVQSLGIMNTHLAVILIDITVNIPFATFLFYTFTSTVPKELEEAARMDGAGPFRIFLTIVFPLLRPVAITVAILTTLNVWNDFMGPLYFLQSRSKQVILQEVARNVGQFSTDWTSLFPMMVLGILPLLIFYLVMQRFIIGGVVAGALKG